MRRAKRNARRENGPKSFAVHSIARGIRPRRNFALLAASAVRQIMFSHYSTITIGLAAQKRDRHNAPALARVVKDPF